MFDGILKGLPTVMRAIEEMGKAEDASPEVAVASGYAWASLRKEQAKLEGSPEPVGGDLAPADIRLKAGVFLDPANAPHGFDTLEITATMTAAEWGILVSLAKNMGSAMNIPSMIEIHDKLYAQVLERLGEVQE